MTAWFQAIVLALMARGVKVEADRCLEAGHYDIYVIDSHEMICARCRRRIPAGR